MSNNSSSATSTMMTTRTKYDRTARARAAKKKRRFSSPPRKRPVKSRRRKLVEEQPRIAMLDPIPFTEQDFDSFKRRFVTLVETCVKADQLAQDTNYVALLTALRFNSPKPIVYNSFFCRDEVFSVGDGIYLKSGIQATDFAYKLVCGMIKFFLCVSEDKFLCCITRLTVTDTARKARRFVSHASSLSQYTVGEDWFVDASALLGKLQLKSMFDEKKELIAYRKRKI